MQPDTRLRPGMTARVFLVREERLGVLAIPREFIANRGGRSVSQVRDARGQLTERPIQLGAEGRILVEVRSGLKEGDVVVAWR